MDKVQKELARSFCVACPEAFRSFVAMVFGKGFETGLAEGRRQRLITDSAGVLVDSFIKDECILEPGAKVQASLLFKAFSIWYSGKYAGNEVLTVTWFGRRLASRFPRSKSNGLIFYRGVILKAEIPRAMTADDHRPPIAGNLAESPAPSPAAVGSENSNQTRTLAEANLSPVPPGKRCQF